MRVKVEQSDLDAHRPRCASLSCLSHALRRHCGGQWIVWFEAGNWLAQRVMPSLRPKVGLPVEAVEVLLAADHGAARPVEFELDLEGVACGRDR